MAYLVRLYYRYITCHIFEFKIQAIMLWNVHLKYSDNPHDIECIGTISQTIT